MVDSTSGGNDQFASERARFFESSDDLLFILDSSGHCCAFNSAWTRVVGLESAELLGLPLVERMHPDDAREAQRTLDEVTATSGVTRLVARFRYANGEHHNLAWTLSEDGGVIFGAAREVVPDEAEKVRSALTKELERSNEELQQFAYIASHDLQEPLRMISSYTELLQKRYQGELDADADVFIGFVVDGAKRMQRLLEDLLKYSRVDSHRGSMKLVDSGDVVRFALANLTIAIRDSDAEINLGDLPLVLADESQLMQLFQNLIGNALKFHNPGAVPHVYVGAVHQDHQWLFSVEDDGIGIGGEYSDAVFDVFRRLHTVRAYAGTGIGLAVCKRIVERHGGTIWVEPNEAGGSSFRFTLPIPS